METKIEITFDAEFGEANVADKTFQVELAKLPNVSLVRIFRYGMQRIVNDRCGGADKTSEEKHAIATDVIAKLLAGEFNRTARTGDPLAKYRKYIRAILRVAKIGGTPVKESKAFKDAENKNEYLDDLFANLDEKLSAFILKRAKKAYDEENAVIDLDGDGEE